MMKVAMDLAKMLESYSVMQRLGSWKKSAT